MLIGLAAALLLISNGRIAGISGVYGRLFTAKERGWRLAFLAGLVVTGFVLTAIAPQAFGTTQAPLWKLALGGVLIGVGTQLGNGCTSGHGVCGIGRGSKRSLAATVTFMVAGAIVVALVGGRL